MTVDISNWDKNRAEAVLVAAAKHGMFPLPNPSVDINDHDAVVESVKTMAVADQVMQAEQIIVLADQARELAEQAGKDKVQHYDAVVDILVQAEVLGGAEGAEGPQPPAQPSSSEPDPVAQEMNQMANEGIRENADALREAAGVKSGVYAKDQTWLDGNGGRWVIDSVIDAENVEVHADGNPDAKTVVAVAFLTEKIEEAPSPNQPTTSPQSPPSPSSPTTESDGQTGAGQASGTTASPAPPSEPSEPSQSQQESASSASSPPSTDLPVDDDEGDEKYRAILDSSEAIFKRSKLPLPADIESPPRLPEDLTNVGDLAARRLHSQFNACAARAHYIQGIERRRRIDCARMRKRLMKGAMRDARESLGKDATVTEITQLAEEQEKVATWISREERHQDREEAYKSLFEIYTENVAVLSRDWTMRSSDEQGSR